MWLDKHGDPTEREVATATPSQERGRVHERLVRRKIGNVRPVRAASWNEAVVITSQLMQDGVSAIWGGSLEARLPSNPNVILRGKPDLMRRVRSRSSPNALVYQPIEIKIYRAAHDVDWLQLDFYQYLLQLYQGNIEPGELWLGSREPGAYVSYQHEYSQARLFESIEDVLKSLNSNEIPPIFFSDYCQGCQWHTSCKETAEQSSDIALLPGLRRETWVAMRQSSIQHVDEVAALPVADLKRLKGLGKITARETQQWAEAWLKKEAFVFEPISRKLSPTGNYARH